MAPAQLPVLFTALGVVLIVVLYAFYFNRLVAWLVVVAVRWRSWDPTSAPGSIYVELESIQFSLLSGRLLMRDLRYHSSNQSIRIVKLKITWKYWLWRTRQGIDVAVNTADDEEGPPTMQSKRTEKDSALPCRFAIYIDGFEWFLYNRTWSYEDILSRLKSRRTRLPTHGVEQHLDNPLHGVTSRGSTTGAGPSRYHFLLSGASAFFISLAEWCTKRLPIANWMDALPIGLRIERGAIILGNVSTPTIGVARFAYANGTFDVVSSRCRLDLYKQVLNLHFKRVQFLMNENPDYQGRMLDIGEDIFEDIVKNATKFSEDEFEFTAFRPLLESYLKRRGPPKKADNWSQSTVEYARWANVLDTQLLELTYYADVAGTVPNPATEKRRPTNDDQGMDVGNGDLPPEWGIEVVVHDAELAYGPWTDRQRAELQRIYFPQTWTDQHATPRLQPGDTRLCVEMAVLVDFRGTTSLQIPFREASEDWQYDSFGDRRQKAAKRQPAKLSAKIGDSSVLRYSVPMVADETGYAATLDLNMTDLTVAGLDTFEFVFIRSESCRVLGTMPTPLKCQAHRRWDFNISLTRSNIHLLRDHITLIQDLIKDWASGPPPEAFCFIPTSYELAINLSQFDLVLYVNDHNIVDQLSDTDKNALLTLSAASLASSVIIPGETYRPELTSVPFSVAVPDLSVHLSLPKWNTHAVFASPSTTDIGRIGLLQLEGTFAYYAETRYNPEAPNFVDRLMLNIHANQVMFKSFGWAVRHFMIVKDNYFGMFTNQKTSAEYKDDKQQNLPVGDPVDEKWREGKSNVFEVVLDLRVEDGLVALPASLMGAEKDVAGANDREGLGHVLLLSLPELTLTMRLHDYFMEMSLNLHPVTGAVVSDLLDTQFYSSQLRFWPDDMFMIDGIHIVGNRLFGPQPRTSTYLCLWELSFGALRSSISTVDATYVASAFGTFTSHFNDVVDAPAKDFALLPDPDATFVKLRITSVEVLVRTPRASVHLVLPRGVELNFNDHAGEAYKSIVSVVLPVCILRALVSTRPEAPNWLEAASLRFDAYLDMYIRPEGFVHVAARQRDYCREQDMLTRRAPWLYENHVEDGRTPRGFYHGSMYLPRAVRPAAHKEVVADISHTSSHGSLGRLVHDSPGGRRRTAVEMLRDDSGDDDDGLSEADRDAILARSRPITPRSARVTYVDADNDSMLSSNDESDDGDESPDEISSDGEWSDDDLTTAREAWPFATSYIKIVPRYRTGKPVRSDSPLMIFDTHPSLWRHSSDSPHRVPRRPGTGDEDQPMPLPEHENIARKTIRFRTRQQVEIFVSPLLVTMVDGLLETQEAEQWTFEMRIDEHIADTVATVKAIEKGRPPASRTILDVAVPSVRFRAVQRIMSADEAAAFAPDSTDTQLPTQSQIVSILDVQILGTTLITASAIPNDHLPLPWKRVDVQYDSLSAHVRAAQSHAQSGMNRSSRSLSTEVEVTSGKLRVSVAEGAVRIKTGDFALAFQERSSEAVIGSAISALRTVRQIRARFGTHQFEGRRQFRRFVVACVNASALRPGVTDPLAQAQPPFFLGSGVPAAIRSDAQWRVLTHLRHLLRFYNVHERATLQRQCATQADINDGDSQAVENVLRQRLGEWVVDANINGVSTSPLALILYPSRKGRTSAVKPTSPIFSHAIKVLFTSGTSSFALYKGDERTDQLSSGPLEIQLHSRPMAFHAIVPGTSTSQLSLSRLVKDTPQRSANVLQVAVSIKLQSCSTTVSPSLIPFTRHVIRVSNGFSAHFPQTNRRPSVMRRPARRDITPSGPKQPLDIVLDLAMNLPSLVFSTTAQHIAVDLHVRGFQGLLSARLTGVKLQGLSLQTQTTATALELEELLLVARDLRPREEPASQAKDVLASFVLRRASASSVAQSVKEQAPKIRAAVQLNLVQVSIPRSALRLYRLIEEWRVNYLPELELMLQGLVSELDREPKRAPRARFDTHVTPALDVHVKIDEMRLTGHVMHGTWLSWDLRDMLAYGRSSQMVHRAEVQAFGLEIGAQGISIGPNAEQAETGSVRMTLPACRVAGTLSKHSLNCLAVLETFRVKLKPHHFDDILAIQQKFGADFNDMLDVVAETRKNRPTKPTSNTTRPAAPNPLKYNVQFNVQPFRIGVAGPSATQWFNVANVAGAISNVDSRVLQLSVRDVGLELIPNTAERFAKFGATSAIAYVSVDISVQVTRHRSQPEEIQVQIPRLHAVMQPSSIGELGDLVDFVQAEMVVRSQQRATEIAEMRNKTKKVLRTWDIKPRDGQAQDPAALFNNRIINLSISRLGIAFPLTHDHGIALHDVNPHASATFVSSTAPAFLLSIAHMQFTTKRDEAGTARIKEFSLQFVPRFNQAVPADFDHKAHDARNQLLYPRFNVEVRSRTSAATRSLHVSGDVEGFILNLDPGIAEYIFSMVDVYREGKARLQRMAPLAEEMTASIPRSSSEPVPRRDSLSNIPTSHVRLKLTFASGRVNLATTNAPHRQGGKDVFHLPKLSVWTEYKATSALRKFGSGSGDEDSSILLLSGLIHSSNNVLTPTLLPFLSDLSEAVESRMKRNKAGAEGSPRSPTIDVSVSSVSSRPSPAVATSMFDSARSSAPVPPTAMGSMRIHFSLRIDESSLQFSCAPDVEITSGLFWKSGGLAVTVSPGARQIACSGYISGVTAKLQHAFVPETFFEASTENLAFAISFSKTKTAQGRDSNVVSIIIDAELSVNINVQRLQDGFCFKAVWLDRLPVFEGSSTTSQPRRQPSTIGREPPQIMVQHTEELPLSTIVLFRSRRLMLGVDIPRTATCKLEVTSFVSRGNVSDVLTDIAMSFSKLSLECEGYISGVATVPDFSFQSLRRRNRTRHYPSADELKMLQLSFACGRTEISLFSSGQKDAKLFHYEADPVHVHAFDDWAKAALSDQEQQLSLNFGVEGSTISLSAGLLLVSKALEMQQKVQTLVKDQRNGALRDSRTFRSTWTPAPHNPLSNVANAMISSARTRFKERTGLSYMIVQNMRLKLDSLRIYVYPNSLLDNQVVFVHGVDLFAHLRRIVADESMPLQRMLLISFASLYLSKFTNLPTEVSDLPPSASGSSRWMHQVLKRGRQETILTVPGLRARMLSEETAGPPDGAERIVTYRFRSAFRRTVQNANSDIYVTLNYTLFTDLNELRAKALDAIAKFKRDTASLDAAAVSAARKTASLQPDARSPLSTSPPTSPMLSGQRAAVISHKHTPSTAPVPSRIQPLSAPSRPLRSYDAQEVIIEKPTISQMGEATPGLKSSFLGYHWDLETPIPHWLHEFGTIPLEELMKMLLNLYSKQLKTSAIEVPETVATKSTVSAPSVAGDTLSTTTDEPSESEAKSDGAVMSDRSTTFGVDSS